MKRLTDRSVRSLSVIDRAAPAPANPGTEARRLTERWSGGRVPIQRASIFGVLAAIAVLVVLLVPPAISGSGSAPWSALPTAAQASPSSTPATLVPGPVVATTPSSFWSLVVQTNDPRGVDSDAAIRSFLGSTPFRWVRYDSGTDQCDWATNTMYTDSGTVAGPCQLNVSALKAWCMSVTPRCHAILTLPGENNDSALDAAIAKYIVSEVGFQPDYWAIGNEPTGWTHYGIPWVRWSVGDRSSPTPLAYATDVRAAIQAVRLVDPAAKFIGIEAACQCNTLWFQTVMKVDGPWLSAVAVHTYPSVGLTTVSVPQFLAPLSGPNNVSGSYAEVRTAIQGLCPACGRIPIFINEFNAGPGWSPSNLGGTYPNAVFLAASVVQALRVNVTQFTVFNLQTWSSAEYGFSMMDARDVVGPTGELFSVMLSHLATGSVRAVEVRSDATNVWSVLTANGSRQSLLVVNANVTESLQLTVGEPFGFGARAQAYEWTPGSAAPQVGAANLSGSYRLPPESILLLDAPSATSPSAGLFAWVSANRTQGDAPLEVGFSATVQGGNSPLAYHWDFGDGGSSGFSSVNHVFTTDGIYSISLEVSDSSGSVANALDVVTVGRFPLALSLNAKLLLGTAPLCTELTALPTGGTGPYSTTWLFGDNSSAASGSSVQHCYSEPATYRPVATSTDGTGTAVSATLTIVVTAPLRVEVVASENPARAGEPVVLTAGAAGGTGGLGVQWADNGSIWASNSSSVVHVWTAVGTHSIAATVLDASGNRATGYLNLSVESDLSNGSAGTVRPGDPGRIVWTTGLVLLTVGVGILAVVAPGGGRTKSRPRAGPSPQGRAR